MRKIQIGVIGYGGSEEYPLGKVPTQEVYELAEKVGFLLAKNEVIVVTGGKGGVMEYAARGARKAGGITIGVIKGIQRNCSNKFIDIEVLTGMEANGFDEFLLVTMCDALIVIGGGAGTLEEITIAYRNNKSVIALSNTQGWAEKTAGKFLDERESIKIQSAISAGQAVSKAIKSARQSYE